MEGVTREGSHRRVWGGRECPTVSLRHGLFLCFQGNVLTSWICGFTAMPSTCSQPWSCPINNSD